jgi:hypothetical protein
VVAFQLVDEKSLSRGSAGESSEAQESVLLPPVPVAIEPPLPDCPPEALLLLPPLPDCPPEALLLLPPLPDRPPDAVAPPLPDWPPDDVAPPLPPFPPEELQAMNAKARVEAPHATRLRFTNSAVIFMGYLLCHASFRANDGVRRHRGL